MFAIIMDMRSNKCGCNAINKDSQTGYKTIYMFGRIDYDNKKKLEVGVYQPHIYQLIHDEIVYKLIWLDQNNHAKCIVISIHAKACVHS
jgi:thiamine kinase-like enzyme